MKKRLFLVLISAFLISGLAGCQADSSAVDETRTQTVYDKAMQSIDGYNYDEAIELLNQIPEYKDSKTKIEEAKKGKIQADSAKYVFNFVKDGDFYNPSKVRVLSASYDSNAWEYDADGVLYLQIQGTNRLGGTVSKEYAILIGGTDDGKIYSNDENDQDYTTGDEEVDVPTINKMLKKYWEDYGLE